MHTYPIVGQIGGNVHMRCMGCGRLVSAWALILSGSVLSQTASNCGVDCSHVLGEIWGTVPTCVFSRHSSPPPSSYVFDSLCVFVMCREVWQTWRFRKQYHEHLRRTRHEHKSSLHALGGFGETSGSVYCSPRPRTARCSMAQRGTARIWAPGVILPAVHFTKLSC